MLKSSWRKLSWVAVKLQNLCRFSASKISRYAVCSCVYNTCTCNHRVDDHGACKCTLMLSAIPVNLRRPTHVAFILLLLLDGWLFQFVQLMEKQLIYPIRASPACVLSNIFIVPVCTTCMYTYTCIVHVSCSLSLSLSLSLSSICDSVCMWWLVHMHL